VSGGAAPASLLEVLRKATEYLHQRGCDSPRLDAELLLSKGLAIGRLDLYLQFDRPLLEAELAACRELVMRRGSREPLAYILGEKEFRSLMFEVNPSVFVPRPETETLVEAAIELLSSLPAGSLAADIGTGSGCIAVSLARAIPTIQMIATDRSRAALDVAKRNAARHGVESRIEFVESCYLDTVEPPRAFDAILSNPPYIRASEKAALPAELSFEPQDSLFAPGGDPRGVYVAIARAAREKARPGAGVFVEIGEDQAELVSSIFREHRFDAVRVLRDLAGDDRVVAARVA
jgi:release factor glutamine methyltransferase